MIQGCICDPDWFGPDCSRRRCPTGDDPLTGTSGDATGAVQVNEKQIVTCVANGGTFTLEFEGHTTRAINNDAAPYEVIAHLEALAGINSGYGSAVAVSYSGTNLVACTDSGNAITVEFLQNFGALSLIIPNGALLTHNSAIFEPLITAVTSIAGTKENAECSDRGVCDESSGVCLCGENYFTSDGYGNAGMRSDCGHVSGALLDCPGEIPCNGVGVCSGQPQLKCECAAGFTGADCSQMVCPKGRSWFDYPTATDAAHYSLTECSNAGYCDKESGECACMLGFTGSGCERMDCPGFNDGAYCSGNGRCESMEQMARYANNNGDVLEGVESVRYGHVPNNPATWDFDKIYGCHCDEGFGGYDCSMKSCPFGDDPDSVKGQYNEVQKVTCESASTAGSFVLTFRGADTVSLASDATAEEVETALEALRGIVDVNVFLEEGTAGTAVCGNDGAGGGAVVFYVEFFYPTGNVSLIKVKSTINLGSVTVAGFIEGSKEFIECSGRGHCDHDTGLCDCVRGYDGLWDYEGKLSKKYKGGKGRDHKHDGSYKEEKYGHNKIFEGVNRGEALYGSSNGQGGDGDIKNCGMRMHDIVMGD